MRTSEMPVPTPISATIRRRIFGVGLISSSAIPVGQSNSEGLRAVNSNGIEELIHSNEIMAIFEVFYQPGKLFASLENRRGLGRSTDIGRAAAHGDNRGGGS